MELITLAAIAALVGGAFTLGRTRRRRGDPPPLAIDPPTEWQIARRALVARYHRDPDGLYALVVPARPGGDLVIEAGPAPRASAPFDRALAVHTDDWPHHVERLDADQRRTLARAVELGARYAEGRWTLRRHAPIALSERQALADALFDAADVFELGGVSPMWALEHLEDSALSFLGWPSLLCALERGHPDAPATARAAQRSTDPAVRARADEALDPQRRRAALFALAHETRSAQPAICAAAIEALACTDDGAPDADRAALRAIIDHALGPRGHHDLCAPAIEVGLRIGYTPFAHMDKLARHHDPRVRRLLGRALHHARGTDEGALVAMLRIAWADLEAPIVAALGRVGGPTALRVLDAHRPRRSAVEAITAARAEIRDRLSAGRLAVVDGGAGGLSVAGETAEGARPRAVSGLDRARGRVEADTAPTEAPTEAHQAPIA